MKWHIIKDITGTKYLCKTDANLADAVLQRKPIQIRKVLELVVLNVTSATGVGRMTQLVELDLQIGNEQITYLDQMHIMPAGWYVPDQEQVELALKDLQKTKDDFREEQRQMEEMRRQQESGLATARQVAVPAALAQQLMNQGRRP